MTYFISDKYGVINSVLQRIETQVLNKLRENFNPKITNQYADVIEHKDGRLWAIEIMDLVWFGDVRILIREEELGEFADNLDGWFEEVF